MKQNKIGNGLRDFANELRSNNSLISKAFVHGGKQGVNDYKRGSEIIINLAGNEKIRSDVANVVNLSLDAVSKVARVALYASEVVSHAIDSYEEEIEAVVKNVVNDIAKHADGVADLVGTVAKDDLIQLRLQRLESPELAESIIQNVAEIKKTFASLKLTVKRTVLAKAKNE
jgi:hypothetical protein